MTREPGQNDVGREIFPANRRIRLVVMLYIWRDGQRPRWHGRHGVMISLTAGAGDSIPGQAEAILISLAKSHYDQTFHS